MSLLLESEAQFASRAKEVGLSEQVISDLKAAGAGTLSKLAFSVGQPGVPISSQEVDAYLLSALGRQPVISENNAVRRLAFEAQTLLVASLRQIVDQKEDGAPKKIGAAERETRMASIRMELGGLLICDDNEPSHALLEKACQIFESNTLRYLEPSACTSRTQEVQGGTKTKELAFEGGSLIVKDKDDKLVAPTASELQFLGAMTRRGIAFKFARLMTYEQHSTWTNFLLQSLQREAPPGYSKASLHQLMLCDKAAFSKLASSMPTLRPRDDGTFQLGERLLELRNDPAITLYLAPLARQSNAASASQRPAPYTTSAPSRPTGANTGGGKSKGKGKKGKTTPPMPQALRNKWHRTGAGEPLCFAYSLGGCDHARDGERCPKGWQLCAEPKCLQPHGLSNHPKKAS